MPHVYVIRHGQTTCNAQGIIQGPRIDAELSPEGHAQARALADAFGQTHLDAVYTSPMRRARDTAQALITHRDAASAVAPEAYELDFGDYCGRRGADIHGAMQQVYDAWDLGFVDKAFPGGESPLLAQHRIRSFTQTLWQEAARHDIAVVAHGRINKVLLATMLGLPLHAMRRFPQANAAITHLERTGDGYLVRRSNDTTHLT